MTLVSHGLGTAAAKGGKLVTGLFKQGREPVRNVVSRGFDTAIKDVPNIGVKDVGSYLRSAAKETNNPFQRKIIEDLESKFAGESGSYKSKEFADILSGLRDNSYKLAEKHGIPENQVKEVVSKLEERFLPLRANVSKTMGLLSGASNALEKGNVRRVAEIFGELPEKIAIDSGVFTKDQVIRGFLLENADAIRNKFIAPVASEKLTEFANKTGWFGHLSGGAMKEVLAQIGLNGFADGKIAKLFAQYSFGSAKDPVTRELRSALQGKIIEEQSGFILGKGGPINQIASQYQGNPYQQFISNQMNAGLGNQLRASGLDQSSYGLSKVASLNSELASRGLNDFIGLSLGGLQSLIGAHGLGGQIGQNLGGGYTSYGKSLNDRWIAMNQMLGGFGEAAGKFAM